MDHLGMLWIWVVAANAVILALVFWIVNRRFGAMEARMSAALQKEMDAKLETHTRKADSRYAPVDDFDALKTDLRQALDLWGRIDDKLSAFLAMKPRG